MLGASNYTYAEATFTQSLPDWIGAHIRMFRFLGGLPQLLVPDNLKSGVNKASFYDPEINRSYGAMAAHYGVGVLPARPRKPRDKAKVEAGVRFAQTYILGRLRHQTFFSLAESTIAALIGHSRGSVTSKYIHTLDAALIMAADTISGYSEGLLDGVEFKQTSYALDRGARKAILARFLKKMSNAPDDELNPVEHLAT